MHKLLFSLFFFLINPVFAIEFNGKFIQGHFIIGKTNPNAQILIDKKKLKFQKMAILLLELEKIESSIL